MTIEQVEKIDFLGSHRDTGAVFMTIIDPLPWDKAHIGLLLDKVERYVNYLDTPTMERTFPNLKSRARTIQVFMQYRPTAEALVILNELAKALPEEEGVAFTYGPLPNHGYFDDAG